MFLYCFFIYVFFLGVFFFFFFSSRRRHTRFDCDWSSDVCSSDLESHAGQGSSTRKFKQDGHGRRHDGFNGRYFDGSPAPLTRNARSVWTIATQPYPEAHFATFPPQLAERCILAGTSERGACAKCGAPIERIVEKGPPPPEPAHRNPPKRLQPHQAGNVGAGNMGFRASRLSGIEMAEWKAAHPDVTVGWAPSCSCNAGVVPCTVLDPFAGSGTTGDVAIRNGRDAVLIELNPEYAKLAERRCADAPLSLFAAGPT